jgi:DNA polymerase-1
VPIPARTDDTLFLVFLLDPYASHGLKPSAERYLGWKPAEQDAVRDWLVAHKIVRKGSANWGAHISKAPPELVAPYAIGDVERTYALFAHCLPLVDAAGMRPAYEREVALLPMLIENEALGVPLARGRLLADLAIYERHLRTAEKRIHALIGHSFNVDSGDELADAIEDLGIELPRTAKGNRRTARDAIESALPDGKLKGWLLYHSALTQALSHFLRPWAEMAEYDGCVHVHWNQVKGGSARRNAGGAKTGRMSSEPNLQNLTTGEKRAAQLARLRGLLGRDAPPLPEIRDYIEAPRGYTLFGRDYNQQEFRILAHAEDGALAEGYRRDPTTDAHTFVQQMILDVTGRSIDRKRVKNVNFGKVYGAGAAALAAQMGCTVEEAWEIRRAHSRAMPSIEELSRAMSDAGRRGDFIRTIGGRRYFAEPARLVGTGHVDFDGEEETEMRSFEYRLLNYYVQGSAADQTKQAMVDWYSVIKGTSTRFLVQVHDELIGMCPTKDVGKQTTILDACMRDALPLDVPVLTDGVKGKTWAKMK